MQAKVSSQFFEGIGDAPIDTLTYPILIKCCLQDNLLEVI